MKLSQLIELFPALTALAQTKLPAKSAYRIAKAINLIKPELQAYETARLKIAESLGTKTEDGQQYQFEGDSAKVFMEQMNALVDEDVSLDLPTITPDELGDSSIEPAHLAALDGIILKDAA